MSRFPRPSASMVVAFVALLVALGSSAGARPLLRLVGGEQIKKHSIPLDRLSAKTIALLRGARGRPGADATRLFAVVGIDGSLRAGSGVKSASKLCGECHQYDVVFSRDVSRCAAIASIGGNPSDNFFATGEIGTYTHPSPMQNTVSVLVQNSAGGTDARAPFHLAVFC